jgi:tetratricopeptide (TPR) repeat protein
MTTIPLGPWPVRIILLLVFAAGLGALGWTISRAAIGDSVMTFVQRNPNLSLDARVEGADMAAGYSPRDPLIRWKRGGVYLSAADELLDESRLAVALEELQAAARMSPEDYRVWMALGRGLDRNAEPAEARKAFERAVALAPNHFDPRWAYGNHLLRSGDRDGSFAQMRLALRNKPSALPLVFDYAWDVYAGDGKAITAALDPARELKAQMAALLVNRGRVEDALAVWNSMGQRTAADAQRLAEALFFSGNFHKSFEVWKSAELTDRPTADSGSLLSNGGFESRLTLNDRNPFLTWQIRPASGVKVTLDRKEPREGRQSFRTGFNVSGNQAFTIASQTVPVKPSTYYRLEYSFKCEDLLSLSTPIIEVFDSAFDLTGGRRVHAASRPIPHGKHPWTDNKMEFRTDSATEAVTVRIQRLPCSEPPCPIDGYIWFDEFKLIEIPK